MVAAYDSTSRLQLAGIEGRSGRLVHRIAGQTLRGPRIERGAVVAIVPGALVATRYLTRPRRRVELAVYAVTGDRIRLARRLTRGLGSANDVDVSVSADGWVAVAWSLAHGRSRRVQLAARSPGGRWSTARTLSPRGTRARDTGVAITDGGAGVVAWRRRGNVEAVPFQGATTGSPAVVGRGRYGHGNLDAAIAPDGTAVVAWARIPYRESADDLRVLVARRPAGAPFDPPLKLDGQASSGPFVAMDRSGGAIVAWSGFSGPPAAALIDGGGARVHPLSSTDVPFVGDMEVAFTPEGEGVVAWPEDSTVHHRYESSPSGRVLAASVAPDGTWREPQVLWSSDSWSPGENVSLAVAPSGEAALAFAGANPLVALRP